ncbi:hypothetical protein ACIGMX_06560 [Streptomyces aquilus]|uniref:P-loop NTPase n=1 Tax=Streptomyces aquilus TaxID=2548456 RepID=UPI0037D48F6B
MIATRLVLTSAHVVPAEGANVELFRPGQRQVYTALVVWRGEPGGRDDAALLRVDDPAWDPPPGVPIRWGRLVTHRPGTPCETWGVPDVVQRPERPIDTLHPSGVINPGDRFVGNRYVMNLNQHPPAPTQDGTSPWSGLSGAALFCTDLLTGVIANDPAGLAHAHLEAVPAYALLHNQRFRRALAEHGPDISSTEEPVEWQHLAETVELLASDSLIPSPSALLRAQQAVVPFHGRTALLDGLHAWAALPGVGAYLIHGPAGQGKSRLAHQLADQLADERWAVLWLRSETANTALDVVAASAVPALVVVDQADTRTGQLAGLLEALIRRAPATPVKLLLLARTAGKWWSTLQADNPLIEQMVSDVPVTALTPLAPDPTTRAQAYQQAVDGFARHLPRVRGWQHHDWPTLATRLPVPSPDRPGLDVALTLHATALTDLLDIAMTQNQEELQRLRIQADAGTHRGSFPTAPTRRLRTSDLTSRDPLIAVPMAHAIVQSGQVDAAAVIDLPAHQEMTSSVLRYVLASDPERSTALLLPRIAAANESWHPATAATNLLSPAQHPFASEQLLDMASERARYDVARLAIEGLGRIGATTAAWDTVECAQRNDDAFSKLSTYTSVALARMFHRPGPASAQVDSQVLDTCGRFFTSHHEREHCLDLYSVYQIFRRLGPAHADPLLRRWLPAAHERLVDLSATALGRIGLDRVCRPLAERASLVSNDTSRTICEALGYIATPQAVEMLLARTTGQLSDAAYRGLAICLDRTADEDFVPVTEELLQRDGLKPCRWRVYRAIGLRPVPELLLHLQTGINSPEPFERAVAALALARADGTTALPRLLEIQQQTSAPADELLVLLALLQATRDESRVTDLAIPLGRDGSQLEDALYEDALQTLREAGGNTGHILADCTTWIRDAAR